MTKSPQYLALQCGAMTPVVPVSADHDGLYVSAAYADAVHAALVEAQATIADLTADRAHRTTVMRRLAAADLRHPEGIPCPQ